MPLLSVIVPCYNEEDVLPQLFQRLADALNPCTADYEIVCVNDGSRDRTWQMLRSQHEADPRWRVVSFARNFGHQTAVSAGLWYCSGDAAVIIDADLQDPPEEIRRLVDKWREGFQVVYAVRTKREDPMLKQLLAWSFYRVFSSLSSFPVSHDAGDFCLLDRAVVDVLNTLPERNRYLRGLRSWCGFRQTAIEFQRHRRAAGEPKYTSIKSLRLALDGIFSFSTVPLRLATFLGFAVSSLAFLGVVFYFIEKLFARQFYAIGLGPLPGFPTVIISILFLGGVQLICLGIAGEYIGRVYEEVKARPYWIIAGSAGISIKSRCPTFPKERDTGFAEGADSENLKILARDFGVPGSDSHSD
jgi:polyisoprenyl-phosphate glycosyltransferase